MRPSVVVMGVSGCGKTTLATRLASRLGWRALDADDLHSAEAVAKMRAGLALVDADRWPWLDRVGKALAEPPADGCSAKAGVLVACSALRRAYRDRLRAACPGVKFLFLDGTRDVIAARMAQRNHSYMPSSLLDSQLQTLERPVADESDVLHLRINQPLDALVQQALVALGMSAAMPTEPTERRHP